MRFQAIGIAQNSGKFSTAESNEWNGMRLICTICNTNEKALTLSKGRGGPQGCGIRVPLGVRENILWGT